MRKPCNHYLNKLWIARKKIGLGQKSVARLLGHRTVSAVSEYETGRLLPSLRTALKLAAIYRVPVSELYAPMCGEIEREIADAQQKKPPNLCRVQVDAPRLWH
jgi:transcriptional regulator with XRE-family HTH domain